MVSESQIARRVKAIAEAAGLTDWGSSSGHIGQWAWLDATLVANPQVPL